MLLRKNAVTDKKPINSATFFVADFTPRFLTGKMLECNLIHQPL